ncbi:phage transposase [Tepidicaulis marinus]|uniref:Phage transposase n=1 Tax=Tepidicaulis marinus TaxID=1333998 RepID=A0A081B6F7_9HYPH|nr:AAA family ATPase [Tepidicaulis marinus]GAK43625.1 phage transposase [Tepidicaulis marinus]
MSDAANERTFTPEEHQAVRDQIRAIMETEDKSQAALAKEVGIAYGTFTGWLSGSYQGNNDRITAAVQIWLAGREEKKRQKAIVPRAPEFILTPSAQDFIEALRFAQIMPEISVIAGGAGIGKTTSIHEYARKNRNVWIATMDPSTSSIHTMLSEVCEAMDLVERSASKLARAVARRVEGSGGLIIIDEAQHLKSEALDQLRSIYDRADGSVGIALVGNESVYTRLEGEGRKATFAQLFSRVGVRVTQARPKAKDICAIIDAWKITEDEEVRLLKAIGRKPGALRGLTKCLQLATVLASGEGEERNLKHIKAAFERLSTSSAA